ncbi:MAG: translation initiation factor IF-2 N-terminal domain-containing protein, partial [Planctomycetota bacterium]
MAALRVHQLAKELGVPSKAIVEKCKAEGVPGIVAHQSTVKLGLAETIRQWFADGVGEDHAAVETSEKVDVAKVKKKATRKKAAAKKKAAPRAEEPEKAAEPVAETPAPAESAEAEHAEDLPTDPAVLHAKAKARPQTEPLPEVQKPKPLTPEEEKPAPPVAATQPELETPEKPDK